LRLSPTAIARFARGSPGVQGGFGARRALNIIRFGLSPRPFKNGVSRTFSPLLACKVYCVTQLTPHLRVPA
jgi:hypothetical protein